MKVEKADGLRELIMTPFKKRRLRRGLHQSDIAFCLRKPFFQKASPEHKDGTAVMFMAGQGHHSLLEEAVLKETIGVNEHSIERDGIWVTPDVILGPVPEIGAKGNEPIEIKSTRGSSNKEIEKQVYWIRQLKAECKVTDSTTGFLAVLYLMGNYCLHPSTRVLKTDLTWVPIADLQVGDKLIGVEEFPEFGRGKKRKLREAVVNSLSHEKLNSYEIVLEDGRTICASSEHLWLQRFVREYPKYKWKSARWIDTASLKPGMELRQLCRPWEIKRTYDAGWLAGFVDGEGYIDQHYSKRKHGFRVSFSQNPGPILDRALNLLDKLGFDVGLGLSSPSSKVIQHRIPGIGESLRFLGSIRPSRLLGVNWQGFALPTREGYIKIDKVIPLGLVNSIGIETSTKTLIAEGLVSHNSRPTRPELNAYRLDFTQDEIDEWWQQLLANKATYEKYLEKGEPVPVEEAIAYTWECGYCDLRALCTEWEIKMHSRVPELPS